MSHPYRAIMSELEAVAHHYAGHPLAIVKIQQSAERLKSEYDDGDVTLALIALFVNEYSARHVPDQTVRERVAQKAASADAALGAHYVKVK